MSNSIKEIDDPLGFTKETDALLTGLGCSNLTKFKNKRICLDDLKYLTDEDLAILDVGNNFNYESFKLLSSNLRKKSGAQIKLRGEDTISILSTGQKQLQLLNLYLKYIYLQLLKNKIDYFIDDNKNLRYSQVLVEACLNVFQEIDDLETAIKQIQPKKSKYKTNKLKYGFLIGGIGALVIVFYYY